MFNFGIPILCECPLVFKQIERTLTNTFKIKMNKFSVSMIFGLITNTTFFKGNKNEETFYLRSYFF